MKDLTKEQFRETRQSISRALSHAADALEEAVGLEGIDAKLVSAVILVGQLEVAKNMVLRYIESTATEAALELQKQQQVAEHRKNLDEPR